MGNVAQAIRLAVLGLAVIVLIAAIVVRRRNSANRPQTPAFLDARIVLPLGIIIGGLAPVITANAAIGVAASRTSICVLLFGIYCVARAGKRRA
jgi:hypothetical protein